MAKVYAGFGNYKVFAYFTFKIICLKYFLSIVKQYVQT